MGDSSYLNKSGKWITYHKDEKGAKKENQPFSSIIGLPGASDTIQDALSRVNKVRYRLGREYQINCQRCAPAYELRRRGYDVEALPNRGEYTSFMNIFSFNEKNYDSYVMSSRNSFVRFGTYDRLYSGLDNPNRMGDTAARATDSILKAMKKWGDGARAVLTVAWKSGGAHIINVENVGGDVILADAQVGQLVKGRERIKDYMSHTKAGGSILARIDDLTISKNTTDLKKSVKKKEKNK